MYCWLVSKVAGCDSEVCFMDKVGWGRADAVKVSTTDLKLVKRIILANLFKKIIPVTNAC